jgi:hypothetical protein
MQEFNGRKDNNPTEEKKIIIFIFNLSLCGAPEILFHCFELAQLTGE